MEANKNEYFVDGFMIKHFGVWPVGVNKDALFDEQKIFLIYLMGVLPDYTDWSTQVSYQNEIEEAKNLKTVVISDTDIDVAKLQGRDIEELKRERLKLERHRKISEIKKKYGIKEEEKEIELPEGIPEMPKVVTERQKLWDILEGKGLIKKP